MPLYPLMLAGLLNTFGYASTPLLTLHLVFGLAITACTYAIGRRTFSPAVGLLAGFFITASPYLVKLTMQIIDTGPSSALTAAGLMILLVAWLGPTKAKWQFAAAGAIFGLATLVRPVGAIHLLGLALGLGGVRLSQRQPIQAAWTTGLLLCGWALVMSPYWVIQSHYYGEFILLTTHGGQNFLKGHTEYYTGVHPNYDTDHYPYVTMPIAPDDPTGLKSDRLRFQTGLEYVEAHPWQALSTDFQKIVWLYSWHKVPRSFTNSQPRWDAELGKVVDDGTPQPAMQDRIYTLYWMPMLVLFLIGAAMGLRKWQRLAPLYLLIIANAVQVALTFADTRYRMEVEPAVISLAAFGALSLLARLTGTNQLINPETLDR